MSRRLTLPELKKYDITQKVIEALADSESRAILFSIIRRGSTAAELSDKLKIPLSSVYKKLSDLEELTLIKVEKWMLSDKGRKYKVFRSRISKADISIRKPEPTLTLIPNWVILMLKPNIIQLSEFDITQKIIESLSNVCTRAVLFSIKNESKDANQIADELQISLSTVYKTLCNLEDLALVEVDKYVISLEGKKIKYYRSRIGKVEITLENLEPSLNLYPNTENPKSNP